MERFVYWAISHGARFHSTVNLKARVIEIRKSSSPRISEAGQIYGELAPVDMHTSRDALFKAIECADIDAVRDLIQQSDLDLSAVNRDGQTPIHVAIASGRRDVAILIIGHSRCDINAVNRQGYTPLMLAVEQHQWRLVKALVNRDATINVDRVGRETAQEQAASLHGLIWMGAKGDVCAAHRVALTLRLDSFEALFADQHAALRRACERGDVIDINAWFDEGVDASFVLMRMLDNPSSLSAVRGAAVRHLIAAGADLPAALDYAVAANNMGAVRALLMLGQAQDVMGEMALMNAARDLDVSAMSVLVASGVKGETTLAVIAQNANAQAVKQMLDAPQIMERLDVAQVLMGLAQGDSKHAATLLIDHGVSPVDALSQLVQIGRTGAAKVLIGSGAEATPLLRSLAMGCADRPQQMGALCTLIAAGADSAPLLCEMAKGRKNLTAAKMLITAGAKVSDAMEYAALVDRDDLEQTLRQVRQDILHMGEQMASSGHNGVVLAATIMAAKDYVASPQGNLYRMVVQQAANHHAPGRPHYPELLRALERVDWNAVTELVATDPDAASEALLLLSRFEPCLPLARVLVSAGASLLHTMVDGVSKRDLGRLIFLLRAGSPEGLLLAKVLERDGGAELAKALIEHEHIHTFKILDYLVECGQQARLKHFIPAVMDGQQALIHALAQGSMKLAGALIKEQVDTTKALVSAILTGEADAAKLLVFLGVDTASALAQALAGKHDGVAQVLLTWGADPSLALRDEAALRDPDVTAQLVALMHD